MCSKCESNLTVAINSLYLECVPCDYYYGWLIYIGLQIIPLTVMLLLLLFFGVSLNYLSTNAYILFSQMVTLWFPGMPYPSWFMIICWPFLYPNLYPLYSFAYSIWSLDFIAAIVINIPILLCFPGMTTIQVIAFQYISAFYPLLIHCVHLCLA